VLVAVVMAVLEPHLQLRMALLEQVAEVVVVEIQLLLLCKVATVVRVS
jgi:hypothetical protein